MTSSAERREPPPAWPVAPPVPARPGTDAAPVTQAAAGRPDPGPARRPARDRPSRRGAPPDPDAERVLVERAQGGDREAFRRLYEDNVGTVLSFLARRVGPDAAEDLAAETFAKAFERLDRFEWRGIPLRAWLLRIAYHEIVARSRKRSTGELATDDPRPDPHEGHEELVVDHLTVRASLASALASLGSQQRLAIELRYLRGLSVAETAEVLGIGNDAVRALTYRSLTSLRAALAPT